MNIAILASGKGSNAKAIIDKINAGEIPGVRVAGIISDKPDAPVLEIAESRGIAHRYIDPQHKGARFSPESVREYIDAIRELNADLIVLAGFMRILPPEFVDAFPQAIINLHPSLLPAYKGKDAIRRAFEAGEKTCGCSVHYVNNELDGGEIIAQTSIEILPGYDLHSLEEKVHAAEHVLLPQVIKDIAEKYVKKNSPLKVEAYKGRTLSRYRTENSANYFARIRTPENAMEAFSFAAEHDLNPFVLGGGSNVFFRNAKIKSFILKNELPQEIKHLGGDRFEVSSSVKMAALLKFLYGQKRDAFYYLASAPCEIGGAIAMNAGSGPAEGKSVSDFIESVKYVKGMELVEKEKKDLGFSYRHSLFSDTEDVFIISAMFRFPEKTFAENPIEERLHWARCNQDLSAPNCGSLCGKYDAKLMRIARFIFRPFPAGLSAKKLNWALNKSPNPVWLAMLFGTIRALHKICFRRLKFEVKTVD